MSMTPFETIEEALYWAVEFSIRRYSPRAQYLFELGRNRPCEVVDVFNAFRTAYVSHLITKQQYTLFLYAKKYGDLPPEICLYPAWKKMMQVVEPLLIDKGIVIKA